MRRPVFVLLALLLLLALMIGWYVLSTDKPPQSKTPAGDADAPKSSIGHESTVSFVDVEGHTFILTPLAPCGTLDGSASGVLAGTFDEEGRFLPAGPQLMLHNGTSYSYAAFYSGRGGTVIRKNCNGTDCNIFDAESGLFSGDLSETANYRVQCPENGALDD